MIFKVTLAHTAVETYDSIFEQITFKFGNRAAQKFEKKVFQTLRTLSKTPLIFKTIEQDPSVRKGYVNKNCSFFYQVYELEVCILLFWDNRQEPIIQ